MADQQKQHRVVVEIGRETISRHRQELVPLDEISGALAAHIRHLDELGDEKSVEALAHIRDQLSVFRAGGGGNIR